jgi:hypothetical protein
MCLCDADGQSAESLLRVALQLLLGHITERHIGGAVHLASDRLKTNKHTKQERMKE